MQNTRNQRRSIETTIAGNNQKHKVTAVLYMMNPNAADVAGSHSLQHILALAPTLNTNQP